MPARRSRKLPDAAEIVEQLVLLRIEENRLRATLDRVRDARSRAMAMLSVRVQEAAQVKPRARRRR